MRVSPVMNGVPRNLDVGVLYDEYPALARRLGRALRPEEICATRIRESVKLAESPAVELDVFRHAPDSRGAQDYNDLLKELLADGFIE